MYFIIVTLVIGLISVMLFACAPHSEGEGGTQIPSQNDDSSVIDMDNLTFIVEYFVVEGGYIDGTAKQRVKNGSNAEKVIAVAAEGYKFIGWSDGLTEPERTDTNIKKATVIEAKFQKVLITYTVKYLATEGGYIKGNSVQTVEKGGSTQEINPIANEGYHFCGWSDISDISSRRIDKNVTSDITVTAIFEKNQYQVTYRNTMGGAVYYQDDQSKQVYSETIAHGEDASFIIAIPGNGYAFMGWEDGETSPIRQEKDVRGSYEIRAVFGKIVQVSYLVDESCLEGGRIIGETFQTNCVRYGEEVTFEQVTAVPNPGYQFGCWSDMKEQSARAETFNEIKQSGKIERFYSAFFERIEKTFRYDYGDFTGSPVVNEITLNRNRIKDAKFFVPSMEGYQFCGWYADRDYRDLVVNERGRYMLGLQGMMLDSDTLYAKWRKSEEEIEDIHRMLFVVIDRADQEVFYKSSGNPNAIGYVMTAAEREFFYEAIHTFVDSINELFTGIAKFQADCYFTADPVTVESLHICIDANNIPEVREVMPNYETFLTVLGDHNSEPSFLSMAGKTYAFIYNYACYDSANFYTSKERFMEHILDTIYHEYAHTCEFFCKLDGDEGNLHNTISEYYFKQHVNYLKTVQLFLLRKVEINGKPAGIPLSYWKHELKMTVGYFVDQFVFGGGTLELKYAHGITEEDITELSALSIGIEMSYRTEICVEAIPKPGYRFVRWSDGVTTPLRRDTIISPTGARAIFEKIENN